MWCASASLLCPWRQSQGQHLQAGPGLNPVLIWCAQLLGGYQDPPGPLWGLPSVAWLFWTWEAPVQSGRVYLRCLGEEHGSELRDYSYSPVRAEPARPVRPQTLQSYCSDLNPLFLILSQACPSFFERQSQRWMGLEGGMFGPARGLSWPLFASFMASWGPCQAQRRESRLSRRDGTGRKPELRRWKRQEARAEIWGPRPMPRPVS